MSRWPNPLETSHLLVIKKTLSNIELYFPQCNLEKLAFFLFLKTYLCLKSKIHNQSTLLDFLCTALTALLRYSNAWLYWLIDWLIYWFIDLLIYWFIDWLVAGLAVMGQNLILNMNDHGFVVVAYNRTTAKVDQFLQNEVRGAS